MYHHSLVPLRRGKGVFVFMFSGFFSQKNCLTIKAYIDIFVNFAAIRSLCTAQVRPYGLVEM